jgi:hypothetical protein
VDKFWVPSRQPGDFTRFENNGLVFINAASQLGKAAMISYRRAISTVLGVS